jgi:formylglycine-generating enzyme required for sulfatase activity
LSDPQLSAWIARSRLSEEGVSRDWKVERTYRQKLLRSSIVVTVLLAAVAGCAGEPAATPSPPSPPVTATPTLPPPTPTRAPGNARTDAYGVDQVWVPAGTFLMGTADTSGLDRPVWAARELQSEQPQHEVEITSGYWIDRYEVTNAAYQAFVDDGGYTEPRYWSDDGWA